MLTISLFLAASLSVNFGEGIRPLRPELHSSGFGPTICSCKQAKIDEIRSMGFKAARTHDWALANPAERVCDYYHLFPLMHLDATDPKNYHFGPTDYLLKRTREETKLDIFFRLGTSIEHSGDIHFNTLIPDDLDKVVEIFAGTIRHYNCGWADGFRWGIRYWEIWNEPDGANMWTYNGADAANDKKRNAKFTELFVKSLKRLKTEFPDVKVGGPATWMFDVPYFKMLFAACKEAGVKPDFISWHSYDDNVAHVLETIRDARKLCDEYGFTDCELIINEWHFLFDGSWPAVKSTDPAVVARRLNGPSSMNGIDASCYDLALLSGFQTSELDQAYYYGYKTTGSYGYKNFDLRYHKVYYGLRAFGDFLKAYETVCASKSSNPAVSVLAARKGESCGVLVSDYRSRESVHTLKLGDIDPRRLEVWVHDNTRDWEQMPVEMWEGSLVLRKRDLESAAFFVKIRPLIDPMKGPFLILSTPFNEDGSVDYEGLVKEAKFAVDWKTPGLIWPQSNDSIDLLSQEERFRGMEELVKFWSAEKPVGTKLTLGVNGDDPAEAVVYTKEAERLAAKYGVDIALCARTPYNGRTEKDLQAYFDAIAAIAKRPVIIQTYVNRECPTPSVAFLVNLAKRHPAVYGWLKEESDGPKTNPRQREELAAAPDVKTVFSAWGGWQWLYQRRQIGTEGLVTERVAYAPIVNYIWDRMVNGDRDDTLTTAYAIYRLLIDQRNLECGSLRGYSLHYFKRLGLFKTTKSRVYAEREVTPSGTYPIGDKSKWVLEDLSLKPDEIAELDKCYDDMMKFVK